MVVVVVVVVVGELSAVSEKMAEGSEVSPEIR